MRRGRGRRGQIRVIEAVMAALLIFASFAISSALSAPYRVWVVKQSSELEGQGFSAMNMLAANGALEDFLSNRPDGWEARLTVLTQSLLPPDVYFNLTIYSINLTSSSPAAVLTVVNRVPITDMGSTNLLNQALEVVSDTYPYTSRANVYYELVLVLSRGGTGT